jgi:5-oxoprolinase (ATP-hydrolysing)
MSSTLPEVTDGWHFFIDRGGTFTDVVGIAPDGSRHVRKVLSDDARAGGDVAVAAMRALVGEVAPGARVASVRMGTTVATNALLERKGATTCLAVTKGFGDALRIGTQQRPDLFALRIDLPEPLHAHVVEIDERVLADGTARRRPDLAAVRRDLAAARAAGVTSLAVVLVHGVAHPGHERLVAEVGRDVGFEHVSASHEVAPEIGLVARGQTTCIDAYLTPVLRRHVERLRADLGPDVELRLMASHGGLVRADRLHGKDALVSGPAGGAVAVAHVAREAGLTRAIGLDMGGTSTDVCRWSAEDGLERVPGRTVAGVTVRAPMMDVVTVAAGGGSILGSTGRRLTVGPESAGASPGPACYGRGGPATVTDCNVVLGRLPPSIMPRCFGASGREPLDVEASRARLAELAAPLGITVEQAALGFVRIANERMAHAIREVSTSRGHDPREHALVCFGGAGAQHACRLAEALGLREVLLHPLAGVLSALGMGLAAVRRQGREVVHASLDARTLASLLARARSLEQRLRAEVREEGIDECRLACSRRLGLRYCGVDDVLEVPAEEEAWSVVPLRERFEAVHARLFGFLRPGHPVEVVALVVEASGELGRAAAAPLPPASGPAAPVMEAEAWFEPEGAGEAGLRRLRVPVHRRADLLAGHVIEGPALVDDVTSTVVLEAGWAGRVEPSGVLRLSRGAGAPRARAGEGRDPVHLELFANRFMSIAEQMGETLRRTACSTNMKERLDYSCAVFTADGRLVANAPHVPVHLGAMGETVRALLRARGEDGIRAGMTIASNDPYHGGSHLPDVTVVTPVFADSGERLAFVACRGHHADVGGDRPGSMPALSRTIHEEGVLIHDLVLVEGGRLREEELRSRLEAPPHPVRDVAERLADFRSQVAACAVGVGLLEELARAHDAGVVRAYMGHVLEDAALATRELLARLPEGERAFEDALDDGTAVRARVVVSGGRVRLDFTGSGSQHAGNLNAPRAVTTACVLYVLRCLVGRAIPLNEGCLEPVDIVVPPASVLDPAWPAAVAGGNVETSMRLADVLLGAFGAQAASQGTMNNVTFGDASFGYYETLGGGGGAGPDWEGASAVHSHMTNTRMTDVEVLERRFPVVLRETSIRRGSGGAGRRRGGDGMVRAYELLRPVSAAILSERRSTRPFGLQGGMPGEAGRNTLRRASGEIVELGGRVECDLGRGDVLVIETPGGGGFGTPA